MNTLDLRAPQSDEWWDGLDDEVLACLAGRGPMLAAELGHALGFSERAAASVLSMLAWEGRVSIRLVDVAR
jgi:hypothetical protein